MQAMQSLSVTFGLPLCISGITRSIPFPKQMEDHVRRMRSPSRLGSGSIGEVVEGIPAVFAALSRREIDGGDLSEWILGLCGSIPRPCTAKAA